MKRQRTTGMLLGKFMPPHMGHVHLASFASSFCDDLTIVVEAPSSDMIDGKLRHQWMSDMFPNANVVHFTGKNPQQPDEHPDFWNIWRDSLTPLLPEKLDYVFAGEDYGAPLAEALGATFIPCNMGRDLIPISATMIRNDPMTHWDYIAPIARPYFLKRICLMGAESTGKSMLAEKLAAHFETTFVPEYAYSYIKHHGKDLTAGDFEKIAQGQISSEMSLAKQARKILFCDTDVLTTAIWSETLLRYESAELLNKASIQKYDLTLLMDDDTPWVDDIHRYDANARQEFTARCETLLRDQGREFIKISGSSYEAREKEAVALIQKFFI